MSPYRAAALTGLSGVSHGFFGRQGGVSQGIYASLNCGLGSDDDAGHVRENRARAAAQIGVEADRLVSLYQVHSAEVITVERPWPRDQAPRADAMATKARGVAIGVLTADCAPVLLADGEAGVVAAAHAGWRGALTGVLEQTLEAMDALGAKRERVVAAVGPAISYSAYEVGEDFRQRFVAAQSAYAGYFGRPDGADKPHFDLPRFVADRLRAGGLARVEDLAACTYAEEKRCFSYRRAVHRGERDYGRQISAILLA